MKPSSPSRSLGLSGASNFRDLGGYRSVTGPTVRWRTLFRSDHLAGLTSDDANVFRTLGIRRVFDFRGEGERLSARYDMPDVQLHRLPIEPTVVEKIRAILEAGQALTAERTVTLMQELYHDFVDGSAARFEQLFVHLLENDEPLVFHCTAGKDRTGFAAAMILLALDVPRAQVMRDYLLTNDFYRVPEPGDTRLPLEVFEVLWRVQRGFLESALDSIDREQGGIDAYLSRRLGLGPAERRQLARSYLCQS